MPGTPEVVVSAPELLQEVADGLSFDNVPTFSIPAEPQRRLVALTDEHGMAAEKVRVLSVKLSQARRNKQLSRVLLTSCVQGEGKTVMSANLGITLARQSKHRTLIIDADLRRAGLAHLFSTPSTPGITEWWRGKLPPEKMLRKADGFPLFFLASGAPAEQPLEILESQRFAELITQLSPHFEWVIIDSPPFAPLADASVLATLTDGTVFVVRENLTPTKLLRATMESFDAHKLLGFVVNESSTPTRKYGYAYYYGSRNTDGKNA